MKDAWNNFRKMHGVQRALTIACTVLGVAFIAGAWYAQARISSLSGDSAKLSERISSLEADFASTTATFQSILENTRSALEEQQEDVGSITKRLRTYQKEVGAITGTVETLEKLSKTDPELLQKYSKVFFLNEHYAPARLTTIPEAYEYSETRTSKIATDVWPFLNDLLKSAANDGINLYVYSAYRSFDEQQALKGQYSVTYGVGTANQFSADQGYSEHQLGTTVDFMTGGIGGVLEKFDTTPAFSWLQKNAYDFGFVLSYPKGNAYYVYEPWHWRFVGIDLATYLHNRKINFYDMEQREIDAYLANLFEEP